VFLLSLFRAFETIISHSNSTDDAAGNIPDNSSVRGRFSKIEAARVPAVAFHSVAMDWKERHDVKRPVVTEFVVTECKRLKRLHRSICSRRYEIEIATSWHSEQCGEEVAESCIMYRDFPRCRLGVPRMGSRTTATPCVSSSPTPTNRSRFERPPKRRGSCADTSSRCDYVS
jgi:hypothetical protein